MLVSLKLVVDFSSGSAHIQQCNRPFPRPTPPLLDSRIDSWESPHLSGTLRGLVASSKDGGAFSTGVRWQVAWCDAQRTLRLAITLHRPLWATESRGARGDLRGGQQ